MRSDRSSGEEDESVRAAEYALRVLSAGEEHSAAEQAAASAALAGEVARWRSRFGAFFEEIEPVSPPARIWEGIEAEITERHAPNDNEAVLHRRVLVWKSAAGGLAALAASLAVLLALPNRTVASVSSPGVSAPMVAILGQGGTTKVVANWDSGSRQLVLAVPGDLPADPEHSRQLWVIPADGKPRPIGTLASRRQMHIQLAEALADLLSNGATIAISLEPPGGSPTGQPTGPVIASGALSPA